MTRRIIITLALFSFLLTGCNIDISTPYEFRQSADQITKIEIVEQGSVHVSWEERFAVKKVLTEAMYANLLSDLQGVEGNTVFTPPGTEFGPFLIRITYSDGEIELIGRYNNAYITTRGQLRYDTYYFSDEAAYYSVISKYLGEDISYKAETWTGF